MTLVRKLIIKKLIIIGDTARISKYKTFFAKDYVPNWSEEVFVIKKIKKPVPWTYVINYFKGEGIVGIFYKKELQENKQRKLELKK